MIGLLFWRNLFTVGKNVTKHFHPEGLSVGDMAFELLDEALLKRGFSSSVCLILISEQGFNDLLAIFCEADGIYTASRIQANRGGVPLP